MPRVAMIHARMEPELKQNVESIFKALGMTTTEAVTLFYKQVKMRHGLPLRLKYRMRSWMPGREKKSKKVLKR